MVTRHDRVKFGLSEIAKRSRVGTTIVLDDFNDWTGCRRATAEFLSSHPDYIFEDGPKVILRHTHALNVVPAEYSRDR
jgi:asparagine synthase (glutamine-hydrolysing)